MKTDGASGLLSMTLFKNDCMKVPTIKLYLEVICKHFRVKGILKELSKNNIG